MEKIRVLVVDDSLVVRRVLREELAAQPDIDVVGTADSGRTAITFVNQHNPDLVVLDIEMPEMDGLTALSHIHQSHPQTPVVMFSSQTELGAAATLEALSRGASDFFPKPNGAGGLDSTRRIIRAELVPAIRELTARKLTPAAPAAPVSRPNEPATLKPRARIDALAIGTSTGGPNALAEVFKALPRDLPVPILIVQHMPPMFTQMLAQRLTTISHVSTMEASTGMELQPGVALIAPGDHHLLIERAGARVVSRLNQGPPENACRPAVDPLLRSVAKVYGGNCLAVILTGMGQDGLRGCEAIAAAGGQIIAQDEATSVVWGMPGYVARAKLAERVLPLSMIAGEIVRRVSGGRG